MNLNENGEIVNCDEVGGHMFVFDKRISLEGAFTTVWSFENLEAPNLKDWKAVEYYKCTHCDKTKLIFMK